jgi:hypothetical protein
MAPRLTQWTAALQTYLTQAYDGSPAPAAPSTPEAETLRLGTVASPARLHTALAVAPQAPVKTPMAVAQPLPAPAAVTTATISPALLRTLEPQVLQRSPLAIQARPQWTVAPQQVYRQTPPVPGLSQPVRVGDFLLFPDSVQDHINLDTKTELARTLATVAPPPRLAPAATLGISNLRLETERLMVPTLNVATVSGTLNPSLTLAHPWIINQLAVDKLRIQVRRAFFAALKPVKQDFRLVVRRNSQLQVAGGTAYLTISVYSAVDPDSLGQWRQPWTEALAQAGHGTHLWKFLPVHLKTLQATVNLPSGQQQGAIDTSFNAETGTLALVIPLSALGAQVWQQALERQRPQQLSGSCHLQASYYARQGDRLRLGSQRLDATLAELLHDSGPGAIEHLNPDVALETLVHVEGSPLINSVTVDWQPHQGASAVSQRFTGEGGTLARQVVTSAIDAIAVDWMARTQYRLAGWPPATQSGQLLAQTLTAMVKPGSSEWVQDYVLYTVYMAGQNQVFTEGNDFDDLEVEGTLTFAAPYLSTPLTTTFELSNFAITDVPFPRRLGQAPTAVAVALTVRSRSRDRVLSTQQRQLRAGESFLNAKIYRDGRIEIQTNTDPLAETGVEADIFALLQRLYPSPEPA